MESEEEKDIHHHRQPISSESPTPYHALPSAATVQGPSESPAIPPSLIFRPLDYVPAPPLARYQGTYQPSNSPPLPLPGSSNPLPYPSSIDSRDGGYSYSYGYGGDSPRLYSDAKDVEPDQPGPMYETVAEPTVNRGSSTRRPALSDSNSYSYSNSNSNQPPPQQSSIFAYSSAPGVGPGPAPTPPSWAPPPPRGATSAQPRPQPQSAPPAATYYRPQQPTPQYLPPAPTPYTLVSPAGHVYTSPLPAPVPGQQPLSYTAPVSTYLSSTTSPQYHSSYTPQGQVQQQQSRPSPYSYDPTSYGAAEQYSSETTAYAPQPQPQQPQPQQPQQPTSYDSVYLPQPYEQPSSTAYTPADPYSNLRPTRISFASPDPRPQAQQPQEQHQPSKENSDHPGKLVESDPSTALVLNPDSKQSSDPLSRVWIHDASIGTSFSSGASLAHYLRLAPEADNDQGCRAFRYGPNCPQTLLMPLFSSMDYARYAQYPYALSGNYSVEDAWESGMCRCERCDGGQLCGQYVLHKNLKFYLPLETAGVAEGGTPKIGTRDGVVSISVGSRQFDFLNADWNMQLFRSRSRRSETFIFAQDALVYQNYDITVVARSSPLDYVFTQLDDILISWDSLLSASTKFLTSFRVEVLEEHLGTDRKVIRNLLVAAQHWEEFRKVLKVQLERVDFLETVHNDPRWTEGRENHFETMALARTYIQRLKSVDFRIATELMQETDGLIQRVTNLISIDEGYRSRDQNESIRRLTWITFIFLPLIFGSALFSMQLDLFSVAAPWQYYIYTSLVVSTVVFLGWYLLRTRRQVRALSRDMGKLMLYLALKPMQVFMRWLVAWLVKKQKKRQTDPEKNMVIESGQETALTLKWAASSGNVKVLQTILKAAVENNDRPNPGAAGAALLMAIQNGHVEAAAALIEHKEGLAYTDDNGATPLHWAAKGGHAATCRLLIQHGAYLSATTKRQASGAKGETPFDWALQSGDETTINILLKGNKSFTRVDTVNLQALHFSARMGDLAKVKELHGKGSNLEMRDEKGQTVLFHAVKGKQHTVVRWLIKDGKANVHAVDKSGFTALHAAVEGLDLRSAELLYKNGANVNAMSNQNVTPLHMLTNDPNGVIMLRTLYSNGALIDARDKKGNNLVHRLAEQHGNDNNKAEMFQAVVDLGADLTLRGEDDNTPAHLAAKSGSVPILKILHLSSIDILLPRNNASYTPLMCAAQAGHLNALEFLLDRGASYTVADTSGRSLVELSIKWGAPAIMLELRARGADYGDMMVEDHPVWDAVRDGSPRATLEQLFAGGLSVDFAKGGVTLLQLALECGNAEAAAVLLERGAFADGTDLYGWTALHSAAFGGEVGPLLMVLQVVREREPRDKQGWTSLDIASFYEHWDVVDVLDPERKVERHKWQGNREEGSDGFTVESEPLVFSTPVALSFSLIPNRVEAPGDLPEHR